MGKRQQVFVLSGQNSKYKTWHERVPGKSDGLGDKKRVQDVYLPLVYTIFSPNLFHGYSAVRNLRATQNSKTKVSKILKNKENESKQLPAFPEKRDVKQSIFFSHKKMQSQVYNVFCEKLCSFQKPWKSIIHCILILQTIYSIWKHDYVIIDVKSKLFGVKKSAKIAWSQRKG